MTKVALNLKNLKELTSKQRVIVRKVVATSAKDVQARVKNKAPKDSGALKTSIGTKVSVKKFGVRAIIGPRMRYSKATSSGLRKPYQYARFLDDEQTPFLSEAVSRQDVAKMQRLIQAEIDRLLAG